MARMSARNSAPVAYHLVTGYVLGGMAWSCEERWRSVVL